MTTTELTRLLSFAEPALCLVTLFAIHNRRQLRTYWFLGAFLMFRAVTDTALIGLLHSAANAAMTHQKSMYRAYFYTYWGTYAIETILGFVIIYGLYNLAMKPLPGLQRLGRLMFRWAAGIALTLSIAMAFGPHMTGLRFAVAFISQLQQTQSVLTLCMLFFVCLAIRPMGLNHCSKVFGVSLGLGIIAAKDLVASAWLAHVHEIMSVLNLIAGLSVISALLLWLGYFALPEPKRRMIMLPTTSPFLRWNQISAVLNDSPGFVALGAVTEEMFAPAEVEIMHRASAKMMQATA